MKKIKKNLEGIGFVALLAGCPSQQDTGRQQDRSLDTGSYDSGNSSSNDSGDSNDTFDTGDSREQNSAPFITTNSLPNAVTQSAYSASIIATDVDGDSLQYSLLSAPSWLSIDAFGVLSGMPISRGVENVEVKVSDGLSEVLQQYSLVIDPVATVEMKVIDGDDGNAADGSCNIDVILTNSSSGYTETARIDSSGIAAFSLDEIGTYDISVPSTNTGSTCYGGVSQSEWLDVVAGVNSSWVTLIPEWEQDYVVEVVGGELDMEDIYGCGLTGDVDSVTDLVQYMSGRNCYNSTTESMIGWESSISDGTNPLEVDTIDWEYNGIQYNDGLELALDYWGGSLAPKIEQVSSGGVITFDRTSEWDGDNRDYNVSSTGVYTISSCEVEYTAIGSNGTVEDVAGSFVHEIGHCLGLRHTNVDLFVMDQSPSVNEPHELELLTTRIINYIGNENPREYAIYLLDGYGE